MIILFALALANFAAAFAFNFLIMSDALGLAGTAAAGAGVALSSAFGASATSASAYFGASVVVSVFFLSSVTVKSNAEESISSFLESFFSVAAAATSGFLSSSDFLSSVGVYSAATSSGDFSVA